MIRRIFIKGYKSYRELNLELQPLTVIFGPNASGKSNLLDALYLLSRCVTSKNLKEAFQGHRGLPLESFYYGDVGYDELIKRPNLSFTLEADIELSGEVMERVRQIVAAKRKRIDSPGTQKKIAFERLLRYRLEVEALPESGYLRVKDEELCAIRRDGEKKKSRNPFLEREKEKNRIHLRMEGQGHPFYHEIGLDHTVVSTALYEPHYPHITAFRMELARWSVFYLEPKVLMREEAPLAEIESIGPRGENLAAFLNTLKHKSEKDFDSFNLHLKKILPTDPETAIELLKEGRVALRLSENGIWFSARLVSEGSLRMIGLLAAIHPVNPTTLIAFEEPENGVHPVRLKIISDLLKNVAGFYDKQIIVTTHSPILLRYFDDKQLFICGRDDQQSVIRPFSSFGPLFRKDDIKRALEDRILRGDFGG